MNELAPDALFGYSLGYVLFGYLLVLPFWALGRLWNRVVPSRSINPWYPPLGFLLFIVACFAINSQGFSRVTLEDVMVLLALVPGTLACLIAGQRYRRPSDQPTLEAAED